MIFSHSPVPGGTHKQDESVQAGLAMRRNKEREKEKE
jgi:hypothetical protein